MTSSPKKLPSPPPDETTHQPHQQQPSSDGKRGDRLQIINELKQYTPHLREYMTKMWKLAGKGLDYNVVAVFGSQSTGKSTLLNRLFKTEFDIMNESKRGQTTRGVWLSKARSSDILVMDVEGTDGRERGEDQEFERRSALFSMAVAEVIIINLWENMVGLYNGANMGLLKTVFEVNLQLFHEKQSKTLMFFVIRDHVGITPLENLEKVMRECLDNIWNGLNKPENLKDADISDFFDFMFTALPHKILQPEKFESAVDVLRHRFDDSKNENYVFKKEYHKNIPADGFPLYTKTIWEKIIESKDLDLPTQQQLLAQYRCDEISTVSFDGFQKEIKKPSDLINNGDVYDDFQSLAKHRQEAVSSFAHEASRYNQEVYQKKKAELLEKLNANLQILFNGQVKNVRRKAINDFKNIVNKFINSQDTGNEFASRLADAQTAIETYFIDKVNEAKLPDTLWNCEEDIVAFKEELQDLSSKIRAEELEKIAKKLEKHSNKEIIEIIANEFASCSKDMWAKILLEYRKLADSAAEKFKTRAQAFRATEEEIVKRKLMIAETLWESFKMKINEEVSDQMLQVRLRQKFEDLFRYTDDGLPRVWKENDKTIEECFIKAKNGAEDLVNLFGKVPVSEDIVDECMKSDESFDAETMSISLLSLSKQRELKERLRKDADLIFTEVKRGAVASFAEIPKSMWILLLALGFNEIYSVLSYLLSNPIMMVLLTFMAVGVAILYQSGLLMPAIQVGLKSARPAAKIALASAAPALETAGELIATTLSQASKRINEAAKSGGSASEPQTPPSATQTLPNSKEKKKE